MQKTMKFAWIGVVAALLAAPCFPQTAENKPEEQPKYFRLDFTVKELEGGKVVNARSYSTSLSNQKDDTVAIRTGDKVPIVYETNKVSYQDVGVNIDCRALKLVDAQIAFHINATISSVVEDAQGKAPVVGSAGAPLIRNTTWGSTVLVPLRKAVTVFSSDGATTKRQTQLELTATPIP
jgi:hypothetical protein